MLVRQLVAPFVLPANRRAGSLCLSANRRARSSCFHCTMMSLCRYVDPLAQTRTSSSTQKFAVLHATRGSLRLAPISPTHMSVLFTLFSHIHYFTVLLFIVFVYCYYYHQHPLLFCCILAHIWFFCCILAHMILLQHKRRVLSTTQLPVYSSAAGAGWVQADLQQAVCQIFQRTSGTSSLQSAITSQCGQRA